MQSNFIIPWDPDPRKRQQGETEEKKILQQILDGLNAGTFFMKISIKDGQKEDVLQEIDDKLQPYIHPDYSTIILSEFNGNIQEKIGFRVAIAIAWN